MAGAVLPEPLPLAVVTVDSRVWLPLCWGQFGFQLLVPAKCLRERAVPSARGWNKQKISQHRRDRGLPGIVLNMGCKIPSHFALCCPATLSLATPPPANNIQPFGLGHLSQGMCSLLCVLWFPYAGIPFPHFSTWGTCVHPSGPSPDVTASGKLSLLLRKGESLSPCALALSSPLQITEVRLVLCI